MPGANRVHKKNVQSPGVIERRELPHEHSEPNPGFLQEQPLHLIAELSLLLHLSLSFYYQNAQNSVHLFPSILTKGNL